MRVEEVFAYTQVWWIEALLVWGYCYLPCLCAVACVRVYFDPHLARIFIYEHWYTYIYIPINQCFGIVSC